MEFLILIAIVFAVAPILGLIAFFQLQGTRQTVRNVERKLFAADADVRELERRLALLEQGAPVSKTPPEPPEETVEEPTPEPAPEPVEEPDASAQVAALSSVPQVTMRKTDEVEETKPVPPSPASPPPPSSPPPSTAEPEAQFVAKWMPWFGAITFALAGIFLVKYSVDAGLLGPAQRIGAAIILGLATLAAGEWVRRKPRKLGIIAIEDDRIPAALTAAGLFITFAAIYGGHALYDLFPPLVAFVLLAITSVGGGMVAILHGRYGSFVAGLGMLGAYMVPALVATDNPSSIALFGYLGALNVATLSLLRWRGWAWLGWGVLIGASVWPLLFLSKVNLAAVDYLVLGAYAILSSALVAVIMGAVRDGSKLQAAPFKEWKAQGLLQPLMVSYLAVGAAAILLVLLAEDASYGGPAVIIAVIGAASFVGLALRFWTLFPLAMIAAAEVGVMLMGWPKAQLGVAPELLPEAIAGTVVPLLPAGSAFFLTVAGLSAALAFCAGTLKLWNSRPGYWASIGALVPVGFFTIAYMKLLPYEHSFLWNGAAFVLFLGFDGVARWIWKNHSGEGRDHALAAVFIAITAAMSLAMTITFEEAWLSVALALQVPVLAWFYRRLDLDVLRVLAGIIAATVLVRLVGNPSVSNYPMQDVLPVWNWMWYGYGVPALSFAVAARWFASGRQPITNASEVKENWAIVLMQTASIVMAVILVTLQIRAFIAPEVWRWGYYSLNESSLDVIAWLTIALVFYWRYPDKPPLVIGWARRILVVYSSLHIVFLHVLARNPMSTGMPVGDWPLFNLLALAYLVPAVMAVLFTAISLGRPVQDRILPAGFTGAAAFGLGFVYLSLEVRHAFHGTILSASGKDAQLTTQAELYTYSIVWLIVAIILIWVGLRQTKGIIRVAGLGLLAIVVAKVFLVDMSELTGLWRVFSFIGLGLCMMGIGQAYQKLVLTTAKQQEDG